MSKWYYCFMLFFLLVYFKCSYMSFTSSVIASFCFLYAPRSTLFRFLSHIRSIPYCVRLQFCYNSILWNYCVFVASKSECGCLIIFLSEKSLTLSKSMQTSSVALDALIEILHSLRIAWKSINWIFRLMEKTLSNGMTFKQCNVFTALRNSVHTIIFLALICPSAYWIYRVHVTVCACVCVCVCVWELYHVINSIHSIFVIISTDTIFILNIF